MQVNSVASFANLAEYCEKTGTKKSFVAARLGIHPSVFTALLNPKKYDPKVDDHLAWRIAQLLNQPVDYVRSLYPHAA